MAKLLLFLSSSDLLIFIFGWLWMVVGGGSETMAGCGWSWVVG